MVGNSWVLWGEWVDGVDGGCGVFSDDLFRLGI